MTLSSFGVEARVVSGAVTARRYQDVDHESSPTPDGPPGTLEDDVGPEVYKELLEGFLSHLSTQRHELSAALDHDDVESAQGVAHQIKGSASSFGAARLDRLARQLLEMDGDDRQLLMALVAEIDAEICTLHAAASVRARHG